VISIAGRMKLTPATTSPAQRRRLHPTWIAISVEFGPGMRFVAPSRSRNCSSVSHVRLRTTSSRIIVMWAAGPPKAVAPRRRNSADSSASDVFCEPSSPAFAEGLIAVVVMLVAASDRQLIGDVRLRARRRRSSNVEAIEVHHLAPRRYEVLDELLLRVVASIDFRQGPEL
jgi:hypothetical protein